MMVYGCGRRCLSWNAFRWSAIEDSRWNRRTAVRLRQCLSVAPNV